MKRSLALVVLAAAVLGAVVRAGAADVKILSAHGMRDSVRELQVQIQQATGHQVAMKFDEAGNLRRLLQGGEAADVVVLPRNVMDQLLGDGKVAPGTIVDLARTEIGVGVRAGMAKPDMSSADGFKRALLAAKTVVITDPASGGVSGVHMANVFERLGIAEQMKPKLKLHTGGYNAEFVAKGEADMAFQLANEVRAVPGVDFIPLPSEFQRVFIFSGALGAGAKDPAAAKSVLAVLSGPAGVAAIRAMRLEPLAGK